MSLYPRFFCGGGHGEKKQVCILGEVVSAGMEEKEVYIWTRKILQQRIQRQQRKRRSCCGSFIASQEKRSSPVSTPRPSPVRRLLISGRPPEKSQSCGALNCWRILRISIMKMLPRNASRKWKKIRGPWRRHCSGR